MPFNPSQAIASGTGSLVSGAFSAYQANRNRQFQRDMSNTSYQRAVRDMRAAGLNPILAARIGGASTPAGAMAQIPDLGATYNSAKTAELGYQTVENQNRKLEAEVEQLQAQKGLTNEQANNVKEVTKRVMQETLNLGLDAESKEMDNAINRIITNYKKRYPDHTLNHHFGMSYKDIRGFLYNLFIQPLQNDSLDYLRQFGE